MFCEQAGIPGPSTVQAGAMLRFDATPCPLILGADGTIRVKGSGVTLELVAGAFEAGATPEQIAHHCPSLSLATIYSVISHLLSQHAEVQLYLRKRAQTARVLAANVALPL